MFSFNIILVFNSKKSKSLKNLWTLYKIELQWNLTFKSFEKRILRYIFIKNAFIETA